MLATDVSNKTHPHFLRSKMSGITAKIISGKFKLNLPWFWAFNWSKRWELLELSQKLLLASLVPACEVDLLGVTSCPPEKWDAEKSLLLGVCRALEERRPGVFSCCHENTDDEAWCRAMSRWLMVFCGIAWLARCEGRNSLEPFRNQHSRLLIFK